MKPCPQTASALWFGTCQRGKGAIHLPGETGKVALCATDAGAKRRGITSQELLAAAHASSFNVSLANELEGAGFNPRQISTTATVTMEKLSAGWTVTQIDLEVIALVPRVAECEFVDATLRAKENCPISRVLTANVCMRARLDSQQGPSKVKPRPRRTPLHAAKR